MSAGNDQLVLGQRWLGPGEVTKAHAPGAFAGEERLDALQVGDILVPKVVIAGKKQAAFAGQVADRGEVVLAGAKGQELLA